MNDDLLRRLRAEQSNDNQGGFLIPDPKRLAEQLQESDGWVRVQKVNVVRYPLWRRLPRAVRILFQTHSVRSAWYALVDSCVTEITEEIQQWGQ